MRRCTPLLVALACWLCAAGPLAACNVPVFRFALERWPADAYEVIVFHRGKLSDADRAVVDKLDDPARRPGPRSNVAITLVDLDKQPNEEMFEGFEERKGVELPWVMVRYPLSSGNTATVWAGRLSGEAVGVLTDSPVRREVVRRIRAGESAVWLLLECGDRPKDDAAAALLLAEVKRLSSSLKLPELTDSPADRVSEAGPPLRVAFSVIRVSRADPAEQALVAMLTNSEEDLGEYADGPMAFAVFGRGRSLLCLAGKGLTAKNVQQQCVFLTGACKCEVAALNPAFQLLMTADWNGIFEATAPPPPPRESEEVQRAPLAVSRSTPPPIETPHPQPSPWDRRELLLGGIGIAGLLVVVTGAWALRSGRRP